MCREWRLDLYKILLRFYYVINLLERSKGFNEVSKTIKYNKMSLYCFFLNIYFSIFKKRSFWLRNASPFGPFPKVEIFSQYLL